MATTRLMPLHTGKGRTVGQAISDIIDYTENPQKTDGGRLITSWQCDSRIADAEFLFAKNQYTQKTGRVRGEDDVIAYHLRQSFVPGEITPEDANRLGCELAKRFTKGNHAYIVCTHIDKAHIHNHVIWNSTALSQTRKFRNFWGSSRAVRRLNDTICIENGYSIVENPKRHGKSYNKARAPLGALNERRTGDIKTVLNEDIEKLELFLAHNLPDLVCYLVGPVVIFIYLMTVNIPLALISLVPLILAVVVMGMMFRNTDDLMERANHSITTLNSVMIEYISGMKLIKAYNMGSKSFQKFSDAIQEENAMWNETSRRMGPPYAAFVVIIECGMLLMVPIGGMFFLKGSLAASAFLLFVYVGSMYLTEIRPLQELGTNARRSNCADKSSQWGKYKPTGCST